MKHIANVENMPIPKHSILIFYLLLSILYMGCNTAKSQQKKENNMRSTAWKKYDKEQKKKRKGVERAYKMHLKHQSKPMRKKMKKDVRRMRKAKRRKARRYG